MRAVLARCFALAGSLATCCTLACGHGSQASGAGSGGAGAAPVNVTAFDKALFAFHGAQEGARRQAIATALPMGVTHQNINLHVQLDCPAAPGGCDHWDRVGSIGVVTQPAVGGGSHGAVVEIARFITPFGVAAAWDYDVTDLAPLLSGNVVLQGFVDTYSPQGQPDANGAGWLLTATFTFTPGAPAMTAIANIPVWSWPADSDPPAVPFGDPSRPPANFVAPQTLALPSGASSYALRTFVTGHGQGNNGNCAEFCRSRHTVTVGSMPFSYTAWRTCCVPDPACELQASPTPAPAVAPGQRGSYMFPRSGWCPGASVAAWTQDVTQGVAAASTVTLSYAVNPYVNGCREDAANDAGADGGTCNLAECVLQTGCAYDGTNHTEPVFYITSLLVAYP